MANGSTNIGLTTQLGAANRAVFAGDGFCVLHIALLLCVNLCCNGFMHINSVLLVLQTLYLVVYQKLKVHGRNKLNISGLW
jgi:hypothetical protein